MQYIPALRAGALKAEAGADNVASKPDAVGPPRLLRQLGG